MGLSVTKSDASLISLRETHHTLRGTMSFAPVSALQGIAEESLNPSYVLRG
jgi:hypothetical protein